MIELYPEITCDGCAEPTAPGISFSSATAVRVFLKKAGWAKTKHGEFCPACRAKKRQLKPSWLTQEVG